MIIQRKNIIDEEFSKIGDFYGFANPRRDYLNQHSVSDFFSEIDSKKSNEIDYFYFFTPLNFQFAKSIDGYQNSVEIYLLSDNFFTYIFEEKDGIFIHYPTDLITYDEIDLTLEITKDDLTTPINESQSITNHYVVNMIQDSKKLFGQNLFSSTNVKDFISESNDLIRLYISLNSIDSFFAQYTINRNEYLIDPIQISAEINSLKVPLDYNKYEDWEHDQKEYLTEFFDFYFDYCFFDSDLAGNFELEFGYLTYNLALLLLPLLVIYGILYLILGYIYYLIKLKNSDLFIYLDHIGASREDYDKIFGQILFKIPMIMASIIYSINLLLIIIFKLPIILLFSQILLPVVIIGFLLKNKAKDFVNPINIESNLHGKLNYMSISMFVIFIIAKLLKVPVIDYIFGYLSLQLLLAVGLFYLLSSNYVSSKKMIEQLNIKRILDQIQKISSFILILLVIIPIIFSSFDIVSMLISYDDDYNLNDPNVVIYGNYSSNLENPMKINVELIDQRSINIQNSKKYTDLLIFLNMTEYQEKYPQIQLHQTDFSDFENGAAIISSSLITQNSSIISNNNIYFNTSNAEYNVPVSNIYTNLPGIDLLVFGSSETFQDNMGFVLLSVNYYSNLQGSNMILGNINENIKEQIYSLESEFFIVYYDKTDVLVNHYNTGWLENIYIILSLIMYFYNFIIIIITTFAIGRNVNSISYILLSRGFSSKDLKKVKNGLQIKFLMILAIYQQLQDIVRWIISNIGNFEGNNPPFPSTLLNPIVYWIFVAGFIIFRVR
ncbi:MAG: hypothetical protein INQ03_24780 [Candidatus Heimdallarchaeota archaeon]|nr:hypothetical protein [Candidatus Heimdallarchaeota archaeon]